MLDPSRSKVLVVDDHDANRELIRAHLETCYDVVEAASGEAALAVFEAEQPDIVLLDVMMPTMSGLDVCRRIKREGNFRPVLLITALDGQEDRNAGLAAGADDFLTKPVDGRELLLRVGAFVKLREQDQLIRHQVQELLELDALKNDLVSLIVHDLRNPLTSLLCHLELLKRHTSDGQIHARLAPALRSAEQLRDAVDDLLEVRLLEEGRLQPHLARVAVSRLLEEAIEFVEGARCESHVEVALAIEQDASLVLDCKLVRRGFENLLVNAVKYSPPGATVDVVLRGSDDIAEVEIADRGPGIPRDLKPHVFEKFATVEARRGEARRGYGLGLYLVRLVATLHGGEITVDDRAGGGTVFRMVIGSADRQTEPAAPPRRDAVLDR